MSISHKITNLSTLLEVQKRPRGLKEYQTNAFICPQTRICLVEYLRKVRTSGLLTRSITVVSLVGLSINFLFPHLALAGYADKTIVLTFDFSKPAKIMHYTFAFADDLSAKALQENENNVANYKVLSALVEIKQEKTAEAIKENDKNVLARKQGANIKKETLAVKLAVSNSANNPDLNNKTVYVDVPGEFRAKSVKKVTITAYSSTPDQTDSTPFITASNKHVRDGIVAANFLPFGTKIRFPEIFGDKIFVVEDRMKSNVKVDIWFPTRQAALNFGARYSQIEILEAL